MTGGMVKAASVVTTSPLTVRESADATPVPARVVGGSSYTPVIGDRVLVAYVLTRFYVLGGA